MIDFLATRFSGILLIAALLHLWQGFCVALEPAAAKVTSIWPIAKYVGATWTAAILLCVGAFALVGLMVKSRRHNFLLVAPQQLVLLITGMGAVNSAWIGSFADGILRPHLFIAADQSHVAVLAALHTLALICYYGRGNHHG